MTNVVMLHPAKDPDVVLQEAIGQYGSVCVIGWDVNGEMDLRVDLNLSVADAYLLMAVAQRALVDHMCED